MKAKRETVATKGKPQVVSAVAPQIPRNDIPQLPDPPLQVVDLPHALPIITQGELITLADAHRRFQLARADFDAKRATLTLKLLQLCNVESGSLEVKLCKDGTLMLTDWSSEGPADVTKLV
jgi:hypothetical protein